MSTGTLARLGAMLALAMPAAAAAQDVVLERVTDRAGASTAVGPSAAKWGFMCSVVARRGTRQCAITFARPAGEPWDARTPNEAPVAFWDRGAGGAWTSTLLDGPKRTYQTPTLAIEPNGRADVFTLYPGDTHIYWHRETRPGSRVFERREIAIPWGAYMGGAMDHRGRVLLAYWGTSRPGTDAGLYENGAVGWTLVDPGTGHTCSGIAEATGVPYCYPQVAFDGTGAHILAVRSEVMPTLLVGSRNHYTELRYYHAREPGPTARWRRVDIMRNDRALIQPLGCVVDGARRVHLLYNYWLDQGEGRYVQPALMYAVSRDPVSGSHDPEFATRTLREGGWDGRLCQTDGGRVHVLAYRVGRAVEVASSLPGEGAQLTAWSAAGVPEAFCRIFPLHRAGKGSLTGAIEGLAIGVAGTPNESCAYTFTLPVPR